MLFQAHLLHDGKDVGLALVVPVCSDAEVDLLVELVCLVGCRELEDAARRGRRRRTGYQRGASPLIAIAIAIASRKLHRAALE